MKQVKSKTKKIKVLLVGLGGPAGINVAKLLKKYKNNIETFGVEIPSFPVIPKFVDHFSEYPREYDENIVIPWYVNYIKKNKINVVIQTVAEALILMDTLKKKLEEEKISVKILVSSKEVNQLCHEKDKLYSWMNKNFPDYMGKWVCLSEVIKSKTKLWKSSEYFIKPITGRGSRGCRKVSESELNFLLKDQKTQMKGFVAMEVLPGKEWTVDCYVNQDGSFSYVIPRLRLALSGGISSSGKTDNNKQIIRQTKEVLEKMGCYGPVFIQWKEDGKGKIKMVEVNPRASGGMTITAQAGGNLVESMLAEIKGMPIRNKKWKEITVVRFFEEFTTTPGGRTNTK